MAEKSSSLYKGSDALYDYDCSSCTEDGLNTEAKHFCKDCKECFCDKCVSHHNKALRKHTVLGRKDVSQWAVVSTKVDASVRCDQHQTKPLELFCKNHDQLCCHICVSTDHRRCAAVKHIPDVAKGVHENPNFKRLPERLNKLRNALETVCDMRRKQQSNLEISGKKVLGQIKTMRRDVNKAFDDLEAHTVAELDKMKSSQEKRVQTDVGIIRDTMGHVQNMLDDIKEDKHKGESSAFISFKKCEEILTQGQSTLRTMEMTTEVQLAFQPYTGILDYLSSLEKLGELSCTGGSASSLPGPDHIFVKENETRYNACLGNEYTCSICDICVLPRKQTLRADCDNKSLRLLSDKFTIISSHNLGKPPISLCYVGNSEVAVALGDDNSKCTIQYIRVKDGSFNYTEARKLDHYCVSIACHDDRLFVLSSDALYLYPTRRSNGRVLHKLNNSEKCAVSPDGTKIFISRLWKNSLTSLNLDGTVLHTLTDPKMKEPSAIHVSPTGHVFVGCNDGTVLQVSSDGTRKLTTIAGREMTRQFIRALCYNTNTGDLVVGCFVGKYITVIKLK